MSVGAVAALTFAWFLRGWLNDSDTLAARDKLARATAPADKPLDALINASFAGLVDHRGEVLKDTSYEGRIRIVFFGFTNCPDTCPLTLSGVHRALDKLGARADQVVPLFVTVDPVRDKPEVLQRYLGGIDPRIVGLTGSADAIARTAGHFSVQYSRRPSQDDRSNYVIDHTSVVYVVDAAQHVRATIPSAQNPDRLAEDVVRAVQMIETTPAIAPAAAPVAPRVVAPEAAAAGPSAGVSDVSESVSNSPSKATP